MSDALRRQKDRAAQLVSKGRLPAALEEYRRILMAVPGDLTVRQKIAEILARQGHTREAVSEYGEVVRRYAEQGQFFKATALCRVILALDPKHHAAQQKLAELYAARHDKPSALTVLPRGAALETAALSKTPPPPPSAEDAVEIDVEDLIFEAEPPPPPASALPQIPLFSSLTTDAFMAVLREAMDARVFRAGEAIITEGGPGDSMYALAQGTVSVLRNGKAVAEMHEGDFFGEMALLSGAPRLAGIVAATDVVVLEFQRSSIQSLSHRHPAIKSGLDAFFRERLLANVLRANPLFHALDESQRTALGAAFETAHFQPGDSILEEGAPGTAVYLLLRGTCGVFHRVGTSSYPDLTEGDAFGEISVVTQLPVTATVEARTPVIALRVGADAFRDILARNAEVKRRVLALASERMTRTAQQSLRSDDDLRV